MDINYANKNINDSHNIKRVRSITIENISKYPKIIPRVDVYDYFSHERPFSNVKIILNQQVIWCDKGSLAAASPIFRKEFLKNTKDEVLIFNDIDINDFLSMLEFIYPIFNPEINEKNISCLIELSYRFQFDILKHACENYVMKYLSTIRHIVSNCQAEGDYFVNHNNGENEHRRHDLIEFHNRTCVDAFHIIVNLCRWLKTYYNNNNIFPVQTIISVLQQISVVYLEKAMSTIDIDDQIKVYIYKERAHYLEQIYHNG